MNTEDRFRALTRSMPLSDFGSTRAIQAAAKLADELAAETAAERDRLRAEVERLTQDLSRKAAGNRALNEQWQAEARAADALRAEKAELVAAVEQAVDDFGEGHSVCEYTKQLLIAALAKVAATEGGRCGNSTQALAREGHAQD